MLSLFLTKKYSEKYKEHIKKIMAELENLYFIWQTRQA